jgi:hypothetical protein
VYIDRPFQHVPYLHYIGFVLHPHIQTPQFQSDTNIATDYNQRQEIAHTIQNDFTGGNGEEQDDGKEGHHPPSPRRCLGTKTGEGSAYHVDAIFHFAKIVGCIACRINP